MKWKHWLCIGACAGVVVCVWAVTRIAPVAGHGSGQPPAAVASGPRPRVVVDHNEHDFGFLDVVDPGSHVFLIRNEGEGPLRLQRGGTSCKCTMSHLPEGDIPPGETAKVELSTKYTATKGGVFRHTASIHTNDPDQETVTLAVRGVYRAFLVAAPERIELPPAPTGQPAAEPLQAQVDVYSQAFEHFDLRSISSTLDGIAWEVQPLPTEVLGPLEAKSGYRIALRLPEELPEDSFSHTLHVVAAAQDKAYPPRTLAIPITRRSGGIQLFGPDLTLARALLLGTVRKGTARRSTLTLKVAVEPREVAFRNIAVQPDFVQVRVAPLKPDAPQLGLYRIDVEVPGDSPMGNYLGVAAGSIRIETDHPRVPEINLGLEFAVVGS